MADFIPDDIVEEIRQKSDIVEVISRYVSPVRRGKNFLALCPFHQEKTPSFNINPERQIFHCFGCGVGGDVFKFVMLVEGLSFPEAVRSLGAKVGVVVPEQRSPGDLARQNKKNRALEIYALTRDLYRFLLSGDAGTNAVKYLENRNLSAEVRETFQLGYAPPNWDTLVKFFQSRGISGEELLRLGLVQAKETGGYYDRFRNRAIFPIWDPQGRVIGFGGRTLGDDNPKYLNSPEGEYFNKGQLLYGIHLARRGIREQGFAVLMEGYVDVVSTFQHGVNNAVASLGTAFTREQGKLLMNYTHDVVIAYDADTAGVKASIRAAELLQELGCQVRIATIPEFKDPDEFIQNRGIAGWNKIIEKSQSLIQFKLNQAVKQYGLRNSLAKKRILQEVLPTLAAVASPLELEEGIQQTATVLQVNWETVLEEVKRFKNLNTKKSPIGDKFVNSSHNIASNSQYLQPKSPKDARSNAEAGLLRLALEDRRLADHIVGELGRDFFENPDYQMIFNSILELGTGNSATRLFEVLKEDQQRILSHLLVQEIPGGNPVQILNDLVTAVKRSSGKAKLEELLAQLAEAEKVGNTERVLKLRREINLFIMKSDGPERGVAT